MVEEKKEPKKPRKFWNSENQLVILDRGDLPETCFVCDKKLKPIKEEPYYICEKNFRCFCKHCAIKEPQPRTCQIGTWDKPHVHLKVMGEAENQEEVI